MTFLCGAHKQSGFSPNIKSDFDCCEFRIKFLIYSIFAMIKVYSIM